jgi:nucleoside-diphosphate-sugar epimerase
MNADESAPACSTLRPRSGLPNELLATFERLTGRESIRAYEEARPGDVRHSQADVSAAERHLGFRPEVSLEAGPRLTLDWVGR